MLTLSRAYRHGSNNVSRQRMVAHGLTPLRTTPRPQQHGSLLLRVYTTPISPQTTAEYHGLTSLISAQKNALRLDLPIVTYLYQSKTIAPATHLPFASILSTCTSLTATLTHKPHFSFMSSYPLSSISRKLTS